METLASENSSEPWNFDSRSFENLDADIQAALHASALNPCFKRANAQIHSRYTRQGVQYATCDANKNDSNIFFEPAGSSSLVPGVIHKIFSMPGPDQQESYFFAVHRYESVPDGVENPFQAFPDFGAGLWSRDITK